MSGGIQDVRVEDIADIQTESGVKIKTIVGRGGHVKDIYMKRMTVHTMKRAFFMTGNYGSNADNNYDPKALPEIKGINYRDLVAEDVTVAALLEGISDDPFTGICIANVTIKMAAKAKKRPWSRTNIKGPQAESRLHRVTCYLIKGRRNFGLAVFRTRVYPLKSGSLRNALTA